MPNKNLMFVFSLPRSGSTLLQRILGSHSQISTAPEPWLLLPFAYATRHRGVFAEYNHNVSRQAINDFIGKLPAGEDDYFKELGRFAKSLYMKVSDAQTLYFLDKTPRYYFIIPEIRTIFPDAKFIFLFRNPLQVFASIIDTWCNGRLLFYKHYADLFIGPSCLAAGYGMMADQSIRINFENLVQSPEESVKEILDYLALEYEPGMLDHFKDVTIGGRMGDPGRFGSGQINPSSLEKWKTTLNTSFRKFYAGYYLECLGADTLKTFGYEPDDLKKQLNDVKVTGFGGIMDPVYLCLTMASRIVEPNIFGRKCRQKYQTGLPFVYHG